MELVKAEIKRDAAGRLLPGSASINPHGRPKGQTLKEYIRQRFLAMTDEEKDEFISKLDPIDVFRMAEGNPHQTQDVTSDGKALTLLIDKEVADKNNLDALT